ncbi:MAG TPA: IS1595 family transposase [Chthoniobacterales bacterium]
MKVESEFPTTLQGAIKYFSDEEKAFEFMKNIRWPDGKVCCPRCGGDKVSFVSTRKLWTCKECKTKKQFTIRVGTILEDSPISYDKWICAFWLIANAKNGISSYEIGRALGVTQRTGWFMLQRIRLAMQSGSIIKEKIGGIVEVDESYIGGKARNMHKHTKIGRGINGTGMAGKTAVMGLLERHGPKHSRIIAEVLPKTPTKKALIGRVKKYVLLEAEVHTDALNSYNDLSKEFQHKVVDHAECYVKGNVHTNGSENFWSLLKRGIRGTYVSVEPFHLFRYLDEQVFRFNERKNEAGDQGRFLKAMAGIIGKRLTWEKLTADSYLPA